MLILTTILFVVFSILFLNRAVSYILTIGPVSIVYLAIFLTVFAIFKFSTALIIVIMLMIANYILYKSRIPA